MGFFSALKDLYSLDAVDPRLTAPSGNKRKPPTAATSAASTEPQAPQPSRWKTPEFYGYYLVFAVVVPLMFKVTYELSREDHPNYHKYQHLLSPGWLFGRKVDNSDAQYSTIRNNLPILAAVIVLHAVLRRAFDYLWISNAQREAPDQRVTRRVVFDAIFSLIFLAVLHGFSIIKMLVIIVINYYICKRFAGSMANPILTWTVNIGILFLNEMYAGYKYGDIFPWFAAGEGHGWGHVLDLHGGLVPRWEIHFNITMLRLVSYNMDYYWSQKQMDGGSMMELSEWEEFRREDELPELTYTPKKREDDNGILSERDRIETPLKSKDYSFLNYFAYIFYSPLYLAGPIITFNDFMSQIRNPLPTINYSRTFKYALRLIVSILCMEFVLHFLYVVAISKTKDNGSWEGDSSFQLSMIGYFNLHIIWLKLLIPWRLFRLWSLLDSIDPPENMVRCMSNNYSASGFWRSWHRSFNRWIIRYIYIPLGGNSKIPILNMLAVFTFVALWHDISLRLLAWGWLVTLFVLPEVLAKMIFPARKFQENQTLYRHLCAAGAVGNILMMMAANLVGFAIGLDGLKELIKGILGGYAGGFFFVTCCMGLFVGAQIMFEHREEEKRMGFDLKC